VLGFAAVVIIDIDTRARMACQASMSRAVIAMCLHTLSIWCAIVKCVWLYKIALGGLGATPPAHTHAHIGNTQQGAFGNMQQFSS
jgi:hypothetical protein